MKPSILNFYLILFSTNLFSQINEVDLTRKYFSEEEYYVTISAAPTDLINESIGHAYISWEKYSLGKQVYNFSAGFYPDLDKGDMVDVVFGISGIIKDDDLRQISPHNGLKLKVEKKDFENSIIVLENWKKAIKEYKLFSNNCIDFVHDVGSALGIGMPNRNNKYILPFNYVNNLIDQSYLPNFIEIKSEELSINPENGDYTLGNIDKDQKFTGVVKKYDDNGIKITNFDNNVKTGESFEVYNSGECWYKNKSESIYCVKDGTVIFGYKPNGEKYNGEIHCPDGSYYIGEIMYTLPNGKGWMFIENGYSYFGDFSNGKLVTFQPVDMGDGTYTGNFLNGLLDGNGTYNFSNGVVYVGGFKNGLYNGSGDFFIPNKGNLSCKSLDGKIYFAKIKFLNGDYYEGPILNGQLTKEGIYIKANVTNVTNEIKQSSFQEIERFSRIKEIGPKRRCDIEIKQEIIENKKEIIEKKENQKELNQEEKPVRIFLSGLD